MHKHIGRQNRSSTSVAEFWCVVLCVYSMELGLWMMCCDNHDIKLIFMWIIATVL